MARSDSPQQLSRSACRAGSGARSDAIVLARLRDTPVLDVVVPVHNDASALKRSVLHLHGYMRENLPYRTQITIADNASDDDTPRIAQSLQEEVDGLRTLCFEQKGRGGALSAAWSSSTAPVLAYMDADLSTDLDALGPLVAPLISGHSDLAIGTRLSRGSQVQHKAPSRCYSLLLKAVLAARFSDAQCGFKAIRAEAARELLPRVADVGWFFDTELLVLAERSGRRIYEIPVDWTGDPKSSADLDITATSALKGVARLARRRFLPRLPRLGHGMDIAAHQTTC